MTGVNEIRRTFLEYFERNGHEIVSSSSLVPRNDPTLMFTNAGMVQFKNVFTGQEHRPYKRAVTSQKCVRAGGKHNDLDNVGYTARHHTFFEMLGNFSFGDYFKDLAIELAWNLVTKEYGLDASRLLVTVYHEDDQAFDLWKKIAGLPEDRIIRIPTSDNFWAMGDTGPCGPCSEIFFDHGDHIPGGPPGSSNEDGDRFIEIWNLVFMQFEQVTVEARIDLPKPSIDTGMGLERIAAVLQGTHDNYETDLFRALIGALRERAPKLSLERELEAVYDIGRIGREGDLASPAEKVIADHLRSSCFLIADGVLPSNEGRGYVLRRIMRRAMRYAHQLGFEEAVMYRLVPTLVREMGEAFPELGRAQSLLEETLKLEENRFKRTVQRGLDLLEAEAADLTAGQTFDGEAAFKLYDTYGFPLDLTQDVLRRREIGVDTDGFDAAMGRQRAEARKAWKGSGEAATETVWFEVRDAIGATEFLGYETEQAEGVVRAIIRDGAQVDVAEAPCDLALVLNQTPFYGESGGQVGDTGTITTADGAVFSVTDTQKKLGDLHVHVGRLEKGSLSLEAPVELSVDHAARAAIRCNHSATHLVHEALRQVLGTHVAQKGSLVSADRLRFDFSHQKPMDHEEVARVAALANAKMAENAPVETRLMALEEAMETGAMALFGEKYADEVRVVAMGAPDPGVDAKRPWSIELCGGTHVKRTGDIGVIHVTAESASSAGVRRIEALTGEAARRYLAEQDERVKALANALRAKPADVVPRINALMDERRAMERQIADLKKQVALGGGASAGPAASGGARDVGGTKLLTRTVEGLNPKDLRGLVDNGKSEVGSGVVAIVGVTEDGKAGIAVGVTEDLIDTLNAVDLVRIGAAAMGGSGGGGRPDMAQAGGPEGTKAPDAIAAIEAELAARASA